MTDETVRPSFRHAQGTASSETRRNGPASEPVEESKGRGAKAEVTSGFVSMFRQAQHIAGSTNLG